MKRSNLTVEDRWIEMFYGPFFELKCGLQHLGSSAWRPAEVWIQEQSPSLCSPTNLWWNPCVIFSKAKRCTKNLSSSGAEHTLLSLPVSWRSAGHHAVTCKPLHQPSLQPALTVQFHYGPPPLLSMTGSGDEAAHLAFTGATVCPSAARQSQVCLVAPSKIIFSDNRNYPVALIIINHRLFDCCLL